MRNYYANLKNLNFDQYFFNVIFSETIAYTHFKICMVVLETHLEGTMSQIFI